jgi:hypothetical protein
MRYLWLGGALGLLVCFLCQRWGRIWPGVARQVEEVFDKRWSRFQMLSILNMSRRRHPKGGFSRYERYGFIRRALLYRERPRLFLEKMRFAPIGLKLMTLALAALILAVLAYGILSIHQPYHPSKSLYRAVGLDWRGTAWAPLKWTFDFLSTVIVPLLLGGLAGGLLGIFLPRMISAARTATELMFAIGATGVLMLVGALLAHDPGMSFLSGFKSASIAGVSVDFSNAPSPRRDTDGGGNFSPGARSDKGSPVAGFVERIKFVLENFSNWSNVFERDRRYALSASPQELPNEGVETFIDEVFSRELLEPVAKSLLEIHKKRQSRDIWWVTNREMVDALRVMATSGQMTESSAAEKSAADMHRMRMFKANMRRIVEKTCEFDGHGSGFYKPPFCHGTPPKDRRELKEALESVESKFTSGIFDRKRSYGAMMAAQTLFMAEEDEAALNLLHPLIAANDAKVRNPKSARQFQELFEHYRLVSLYGTILQNHVGVRKGVEAAGLISWYRSLKHLVALGDDILATSRWAAYRTELIKRGRDENSGAACSKVTGSNDQFWWFQFLHVISVNNLVHVSAAAFDFVADSRDLENTTMRVGELLTFPYHCLKGNPQIGDDYLAELKTSGLDSSAAWYGALARHEKTSEPERKRLACLSAKMFDRTHNLIVEAVKQKPDLPSFPMLYREKDTAHVEIGNKNQVSLEDEVDFAERKASVLSAAARRDDAKRFAKIIKAEQDC